MEKLAIVIKNAKQFLLFNIYRPPKSNINNFLLEISKILELATNSGLPFSLIGDFNIDLATKNYITRKYTDIIQTYNCVQTVKLPTRNSSCKKSILDHCICSNDFLLNANVLESEIADHQPLLLNWTRQRDKTKYTSLTLSFLFERPF